MAGKVKAWIWVVLAIVVVGILGIVAMAGVGFYFASKHFDTRAASPASAAKDFEEVRARFSGQPPLIELDDRGHFVRAHTDRPTPANVKAPEHLNVLAYDPDDGRIVRLTIPFWLLRLKMRHTRVDLGGGRVDLEDLKLTVEDLERFGPTLILDQTNSGGDRVLVWSQ